MCSIFSSVRDMTARNSELWLSGGMLLSLEEKRILKSDRCQLVIIMAA